MAKDIAEALEYSDTEAMTRRLKVIHKTNLQIVGSFKKQLGKDFKHQSEVSLISAKGIYKAIFNSQKPEAEAFQDWVFDILESFRQALGYEQYKITAFVESVKNHHINMDAIQEILNPENNKPFIKVHSIFNKTMANIIGEPKPISKDEPKKYYPDLLPLRDEILRSRSHRRLIVLY